MKMWRILMTVILTIGLLGLAACGDDDGPTKVSTDGPEIGGTFNPATYNLSTGAFDGLLSQSGIGFRFGFDVVTSQSTYDDGYGEFRRYVLVGPVDVTFSGDATGYLNTTVVPNIDGQIVSFIMDYDEDADSYRFRGNLVGEPGDEYFGLEFNVGYDGELDQDGYPVLQDVPVIGGTFTLRRYSDIGGIGVTDALAGSGTIWLIRTDELALPSQ